MMKHLVSEREVANVLHLLPWLVLLSVDKFSMELYLNQAVAVWSKENKIADHHISRWCCFLRTNYTLGPRFVTFELQRSLVGHICFGSSALKHLMIHKFLIYEHLERILIIINHRNIHYKL